MVLYKQMFYNKFLFIVYVYPLIYSIIFQEAFEIWLRHFNSYNHIIEIQDTLQSKPAVRGFFTELGINPIQGFVFLWDRLPMMRRSNPNNELLLFTFTLFIHLLFLYTVPVKVDTELFWARYFFLHNQLQNVDTQSYVYIHFEEGVWYFEEGCVVL